MFSHLAFLDSSALVSFSLLAILYITLADVPLSNVSYMFRKILEFVHDAVMLIGFNFRAIRFCMFYSNNAPLYHQQWFS